MRELENTPYTLNTNTHQEQNIIQSVGERNVIENSIGEEKALSTQDFVIKVGGIDYAIDVMFKDLVKKSDNMFTSDIDILLENVDIKMSKMIDVLHRQREYFQINLDITTENLKKIQQNAVGYDNIKFINFAAIIGLGIFDITDLDGIFIDEEGMSLLNPDSKREKQRNIVKNKIEDSIRNLAMENNIIFYGLDSEFTHVLTANRNGLNGGLRNGLSFNLYRDVKKYGCIMVVFGNNIHLYFVPVDDVAGGIKNYELLYNVFLGKSTLNGISSIYNKLNALNIDNTDYKTSYDLLDVLNRNIDSLKNVVQIYNYCLMGNNNIDKAVYEKLSEEQKDFIKEFSGLESSELEGKIKEHFMGYYTKFYEQISILENYRNKFEDAIENYNILGLNLDNKVYKLSIPNLDEISSIFVKGLEKLIIEYWKNKNKTMGNILEKNDNIHELLELNNDNSDNYKQYITDNFSKFKKMFQQSKFSYEKKRNGDRLGINSYIDMILEKYKELGLDKTEYFSDKLIEDFFNFETNNLKNELISFMISYYKETSEKEREKIGNLKFSKTTIKKFMYYYLKKSLIFVGKEGSDISYNDIFFVKNCGLTGQYFNGNITNLIANYIDTFYNTSSEKLNDENKNKYDEFYNLKNIIFNGKPGNVIGTTEKFEFGNNSLGTFKTKMKEKTMYINGLIINPKIEVFNEASFFQLYKLRLIFSLLKYMKNLYKDINFIPEEKFLFLLESINNKGTFLLFGTMSKYFDGIGKRVIQRGLNENDRKMDYLKYKTFFGNTFKDENEYHIKSVNDEELEKFFLQTGLEKAKLDCVVTDHFIKSLSFDKDKVNVEEKKFVLHFISQLIYNDMNGIIIDNGKEPPVRHYKGVQFLKFISLYYYLTINNGLTGLYYCGHPSLFQGLDLKYNFKLGSFIRDNNLISEINNKLISLIIGKQIFNQFYYLNYFLKFKNINNENIIEHIANEIYNKPEFAVYQQKTLKGLMENLTS